MQESIANKIIKSVLPIVCSFAGKEVTKVLILTWTQGLCDLSLEQLENGTQRAIKEHKDTWMMLPAQFREYCLTKTGESTEDEASLAWKEMSNKFQSRCHAIYKNSITAELVRGFLQASYNWDTDDLKFKRLDFIKEYKVLKARGEQYNPYILEKNRTLNPVFIGSFTEEERNQAKLDYSQYKLDQNKKNLLEHPSQNKDQFKTGLESLKKLVEG